MARFTKMPVTVEAVRYDAADQGHAHFQFEGACPEWLTKALARPKGEPGAIWSDGENLRIGLDDCELLVVPGDWIVQEPDGTLGMMDGGVLDVMDDESFRTLHMPEDMAPKPAATLRDDLAATINRWSCGEWAGNTPDFILADFLIDQMRVFGKLTDAREKWYGREPRLVTPDDLELREISGLGVEVTVPEALRQTDPSVPSIPRDGDSETIEDLLSDVAELLRGYEAHHREQARKHGIPRVHFDPDTPERAELERLAAGRTEKAERNARMAERVEAMQRRIMGDLQGAVFVEEGLCSVKVIFREIGGQNALFKLLEAAKAAKDRT